MNPQTFNRLCEIVHDQSGIKIGEGKDALVATRIAGRLRELKMADEAEYVAYLEQSLEQEVTHLLDAVSTNVTSFFRESKHFDLMEQVMKDWLDAGQTRFRVWCAAASTGEEPYTIAMTMREAARLSRGTPDMKVLATDINTQVLKEATQAEYPQQRVAKIPDEFLSRYFHKIPSKAGQSYRAAPSLTDMVTFRRLNLANPPFPMRGPMDMIFCRNVMIYFDKPTRQRLIKEFHRLLKPGGYFIVGHTEGLSSISERFRRVASSVYIKD
ncbi:MAG: CheR family methyltransferase [Phycisphaerales bacterium JB063]